MTTRRAFLSATSFHPAFGGPARSVPQLAKALAEIGLDVALWAPDGSATDSPLLAEMNTVTRLDGPLEAAWAKVGPIDVLHDNGLWRLHHRQLARLAQRDGVARVVSPRGMLEPWALKHKWLKKRVAWWGYQRRALQTATRLHATAEAEASQFAHLGLTPAVTVVPNGVSVPDWARVEALRAARGDTRVCLFMSRLHPKKGLPLLIQAWADLRPEGWRLDIAGPDEGGHRQTLEQLVHTLGLTAQVRFLGSLEGADKQRALAQANLSVLPTYSENFGIVVAEALGHGCPVLTTHGAPWDVLETERCGWWVPVSGDAITEALRDALALPDAARDAMGARGYDMVQKTFAWPGIARALAALYDEALESGGRADV